jgi:mannose-6-phosphate isomerase-like protein (cupin superfamily)
MIDGVDVRGGGFSLVEHPMPPRALAAPLHRHTREDEYSYVIEGRMGALLGDEVVEAGPGDLGVQARDRWHTFWNAGDEPCRILEVIAPAGFEEFFRTLSRAGGVGEEIGPEARRAGRAVQPRVRLREHPGPARAVRADVRRRRGGRPERRSRVATAEASAPPTRTPRALRFAAQRAPS